MYVESQIKDNKLGDNDTLEPINIHIRTNFYTKVNSVFLNIPSNKKNID